TRHTRPAEPAPLRELRRRIGAGVPLRAGGRRAVPGRRYRARWTGVAMAAMVRAELRTADAVPRGARIRGRCAQRPWLDRLWEALRTSRRHRKASRLRGGPGVAAR